jgi:uncharacterized protein involved in type VI secretion and phage assembly
MSTQPFEIPFPGLSLSSALAEVISVQDSQGLGRVQIRLLNVDGVANQDGPLWARVAQPFAGQNRGAFMLPDVGDEVLALPVSLDARVWIVLGGLWNGAAQPPETLGGSGDRVDRWTIKGKAGTRVAIVEETSGQETIKLTTPGGVSGEWTDAGGGKVEIKAAGTTITVDSSGVSIQTPAKVKVQASQVEVTAGMVKVDAAVSQFSGIVRCDVLQSNTVISTTYTPGVGNIW